VMIVWQTLSHSRHELLKQKFYDVLFAIMGAIGQHFFFLVVAMIIVFLAPFARLRMSDAERKAFIIMCSQKSLPTAAVIISYLPAGVSEHEVEGHDAEEVATGSGGLGDLGLVAIPCIVFYVMQVFIDSFLANAWAGKYEKAQALQDKYAEQLAELEKMQPDAISLAAPTAEGQGEEGKPANGAAADELHVEIGEVSDKASLLGAAGRSDGGAALSAPAR
jgi:sodium/bile acid cotransporter 7